LHPSAENKTSRRVLATVVFQNTNSLFTLIQTAHKFTLLMANNTDYVIKCHVGNGEKEIKTI